MGDALGVASSILLNLLRHCLHRLSRREIVFIDFVDGLCLHKGQPVELFCHNLVSSGLPRKDERISVPFDEETYERLERMAEQEERPIARQVMLLVKAALELVDEQGFRVVEGKLRKIAFEELEADNNEDKASSSR